jgi:hypothetical protein
MLGNVFPRLWQSQAGHRRQYNNGAEMVQITCQIAKAGIQTHAQSYLILINVNSGTKSNTLLSN